MVFGESNLPVRKRTARPYFRLVLRCAYDSDVVERSRALDIRVGTRASCWFYGGTETVTEIPNEFRVVRDLGRKTRRTHVLDGSSAAAKLRAHYTIFWKPRGIPPNRTKNHCRIPGERIRSVFSRARSRQKARFGGPRTRRHRPRGRTGRFGVTLKRP